MSEPRWTKGPWKTVIEEGDEWYFDREQIVVRSVETNDSLMVSGADDEEYRANVYLAAVAPDLYEALESVLSRLNRLGDADHLLKARAVLAKARGEA